MKCLKCEVCYTVYEKVIGYCPICNQSEFPYLYGN